MNFLDYKQMFPVFGNPKVRILFLGKKTTDKSNGIKVK